MAEFKLSIADPKTGKTYKRDVTGDDAQGFIGKKIGDTIKGELIGLKGYEFQITGGSDSCGFPMRKDVPGPNRKRILITKGVGLRAKRKGMRLRKTVAGNTISDQTSQINLKITKAGTTPLGEESSENKEGEAETPPEKKE